MSRTAFGNPDLPKMRKDINPLGTPLFLTEKEY
jgi:hypothetical protein